MSIQLLIWIVAIVYSEQRLHRAKEKVWKGRESAKLSLVVGTVIVMGGNIVAGRYHRVDSFKKAWRKQYHPPM